MNHPICALCNREINVDDPVEFDGQVLCPTCLAQQTTCCLECGRRIWTNENFGTRNFPLCQSCYDRSYTTCEGCGEVILAVDAMYPDDGDDPYCYRCYSNQVHSINDYGYKPDPIFYGEGNRFFGVELEVDGAGEDSENAQQILAAAHMNGL